eukprot:8343546-Alexandrium_andersonii.AAC.1
MCIRDRCAALLQKVPHCELRAALLPWLAIANVGVFRTIVDGHEAALARLVADCVEPEDLEHVQEARVPLVG